ncbi:hypothetical protein JCM6882_007237 [Rhodosporidiobolus microsporus]
MCRNVTSLIYGLPVRTYTLARAADAWPHLEAPMRFFDLVALRLCRGELNASRESGEQAVVERVPVEVWMLVRDELVDLELDEAEANLVKEYWCWCPYWDDELGDFEPRPETRWEDEVKKAWPCELCGDEPLWYFKRIWMNEQSTEKVASILKPFRLDLVAAPQIRSLPSWASTPPSDPFFDPFSASFLTLSVKTGAGEQRGDELDTFEREENGVDPNDQLVFDLSFDVPSSQPCPFAALVRLFRLEALTSLDDPRTKPANGGTSFSVKTRFLDLLPLHHPSEPLPPMCRSIAAVGYGLFVRTASLPAAADAHAKVEPVRRFVELVKLRRATGTLQAGEEGEGTAVARLPSELWEMVLQEAIDDEVDQALHRLMEQYLFRSCILEGEAFRKIQVLRVFSPGRSWTWAYQEATTWTCEDCLCESLDLWSASLRSPNTHAMETLLSAFSLCLPPRDTAPAPGSDTEDFLCSSFICLPNGQGASRPSLNKVVCGPDLHPFPNPDRIVEVSFTLPPDANARFACLMKRYRLEVMELDQKAEETEAGTGENASTPAWRLSCTCQTLW